LLNKSKRRKFVTGSSRTCRDEPALRPDVAPGVNRRTSMMKCAISTALLVAFASPLLAGSPTTNPLGGETTPVPSEYYKATEYYVVRDPSTKQCSVTSAKPTSSTTTVVVGNTAYKTWEEAQAAVRSASDEAAGAGMTRRRSPKGYLANSWRLCENSRPSEVSRTIFGRKLIASALTLTWAHFHGPHGRIFCLADASPSFQTVCKIYAQRAWAGIP
jgi:hypothetical protein